MVLLESEPIETFDPIAAANLWQIQEACIPQIIKIESSPPSRCGWKHVGSWMYLVPSTSTCDLSSRDECDDVYTSDESSDDSDDYDEDDE